MWLKALETRILLSVLRTNDEAMKPFVDGPSILESVAGLPRFGHTHIPARFLVTMPSRWDARNQGLFQKCRPANIYISRQKWSLIPPLAQAL